MNMSTSISSFPLQFLFRLLCEFLISLVLWSIFDQDVVCIAELHGFSQNIGVLLRNRLVPLLT